MKLSSKWPSSPPLLEVILKLLYTMSLASMILFFSMSYKNIKSGIKLKKLRYLYSDRFNDSCIALITVLSFAVIQKISSSFCSMKTTSTSKIEIWLCFSILIDEE